MNKLKAVIQEFDTSSNIWLKDMSMTITNPLALRRITGYSNNIEFFWPTSKLALGKVVNKYSASTSDISPDYIDHYRNLYGFDEGLTAFPYEDFYKKVINDFSYCVCKGAVDIKHYARLKELKIIKSSDVEYLDIDLKANKVKDIRLVNPSKLPEYFSVETIVNIGETLIELFPKPNREQHSRILLDFNI